MSAQSLYARLGVWEVWVGKFQFDGWDCFLRRRGVHGDERVPGGPFLSRATAGEAGIIYVRTKTNDLT